MKKIIITIISVICAGQALAAVTAGTVTQTKGGVDVVKANTVIGRIARQGMGLSMDDILRTKSSSYAEVKVADGTMVKVFERSRLVFNGVARTKDGYNAELQSGKVLFKVEKMYNVAGDFRIKTTSAIIGVKGTSFGLLRGPMGTVVELYNGSLVVAPVNNAADQINLQSPVALTPLSPPVPVILVPGQGAVISSGGAVATYSFGTPGAPSALFPGATALPAGGSETAMFGTIGSQEASASGSAQAFSPPANVAPTQMSAIQVLTQIIDSQEASHVADSIYNSSNRPSVPQQVEQTLGSVNIHIQIK